ncbi:MAG TPA: hypothetical protein PKZ76_11985 [Xanthomonadaceae bacterium]|nr:hypothetical protein [Xanthomonadaceae bacterium]
MTTPTDSSKATAPGRMIAVPRPRRTVAVAAGWAIVLFGALAATPLSASCPIPERLFVAVSAGATLDGVYVPRNGAVEVSDPPLRLPTPALHASLALQSLHVAENDDLYFSTHQGFAFGGQFHPAGRVLRWDGESIQALPPSALDTITAVRAFSMYGDARFVVPRHDMRLASGLLVGPRDLVIHTHPDAPELLIERIGEEDDLPPRVKVEAIAALDEDSLLLAFNSALTIGGGHYRRSDLVRYRRSTRSFELACRLTDLSPRWYATSVAGLAVLARPDAVFRDGFE